MARIDLTAGAVAYEPINEENARLYIGARGLGVKYLLDNGPKVDPTSPANMLALVNGPLTGTEATMSGRLAFVTKSPLTGTVTDSHMGGWSAARLRWAGFDALLFTGKAAAPVYAYVEKEKVEIRPATDTWGKGVHETVQFYQKRHGDDVSVMAIGQAGDSVSDRPAIQKAIRSIKYQGAVGEVTFDDNGQNVRKIVIARVQNGKFVPVQ